jgi:hypothetical protein
LFGLALGDRLFEVFQRQVELPKRASAASTAEKQMAAP